jgi:hypothetical protein
MNLKPAKEPELCLVCAWRRDCQKKYSLAHGQKCLEFTRDVALKPQKADPEQSGGA